MKMGAGSLEPAPSIYDQKSSKICLMEREERALPPQRVDSTRCGQILTFNKVKIC